MEGPPSQFALSFNVLRAADAGTFTKFVVVLANEVEKGCRMSANGHEHIFLRKRKPGTRPGFEERTERGEARPIGGPLHSADSLHVAFRNFFL